jgi:predicted transcriptional regulator of viral defense system
MVRVAELAERQWGVVKRTQLEESGLEEAGISRWLRERRLHRIHPGVYAVGHASLSLEGSLAAALFYAGPGAALCGITAGSWLGLLDTTPRRFHVCTPRQRRSLAGVRVHARRDLLRHWHKQLPVTPPAQTLLDIAGQKIGFQRLRRALAEAEFLKLVSLGEVEAVLGRGKPGSARLRAALECHRPQLARTRKGLEEQFLLLCERHSLHLPDVNVWVAGWLVDAVWFERKVVVELDSHLAHGTPARLEKDHRRDLDLRAAGYTVLRYTWHQLTQTPAVVLADLRRALRL